MRYETGVAVGRGAVGEVFKAWDSELDRWVALKFLRHHDEESVARMFREARAQARVDHPNVCKVYDVGWLDDRPFIAMQYVEGLPLDELLEEATTERKIELLRHVCDAVQAAHEVGLIHRDLKPANILVAANEGDELTPYVVDFGLAREHAVQGLTETGQALGTPGYMSPEQAAGEVVTLDRRSDIFSLGVVLYEVLSGDAPFEATSDLESLVRVGRDDPVSLTSYDVPSDLATIVGRCLEKERQRRYASARELSDDLGRFLRGEPVLARPVGIVGRLLRRARRDRRLAFAVVTAALLGFGLIATIVGGTIKYTLDLRSEREAALRARDQAEEVADFLRGLFESSDPRQARGESITARALLERGAARLEEDLADQPLRRAQMLRVIGEVEHELGLLENATERLEEAVRLNQAGFGADLETGLSLRELGSVLQDRGLYAEAEPPYRQAVATLRSLDPIPASALSDALNGLGALYHEWGEGRERALPLYREAVEIVERAHGPEHVGIAMPLENIALLGGAPADERRAMFERVLRIREHSLGDDHPDIGRTLHNLGSLLHHQGEWEAGLAMLERSLSIRRKALGDDHAFVAFSLNNLASILLEVGHYRRAQPMYREAVRVADGVLEPTHPFGLVVRANLARNAVGLGEWNEARRALEQARDIVEASGSSGPYDYQYHFAQGHLHRATGDLQSAAVSYRTGVESLSDGAPFSAPRIEGLASRWEVEAKLGRVDEAATVLTALADEVSEAEADAGLLDRVVLALARVDVLACRSESASHRLADGLSRSVPVNASEPLQQERRASLELLAAAARSAGGADAEPLADQAARRLATTLETSEALPLRALYLEALEWLGAESERRTVLRSQLQASGLDNWRWSSGLGAPCSQAGSSRQPVS